MTARDDAAAWLAPINGDYQFTIQKILADLLAEHDALLARVAACEVQVVERGEGCVIGYGAVYVDHSMAGKRVRVLPEPPKEEGSPC